MQTGTGSGSDGFVSLALSCLATTEHLLQEYRYRIAGTSECRQAAHEIKDLFQKSCDHVQVEAFHLHPKALWYVGKVVAVAYLLGAALLVRGGAWTYLAALVCLLGLSYAVAQYVFYGRLFDRAFGSAEGSNVVGTLEPSEDPRQQFVLAGHHDSPFVFTFLERFPRIAFLRFLLAMLAYGWLCVYSLAASVQQLLATGLPAPNVVPLWITVAGMPLALQLFFMMGSARSPGAGDNLNASSMVATLAAYQKSEQSNGRPLKHTRLILLSTDGEEIGQRGAIRYVADHYATLQSTPTLVLNLDSIYRSRDLKVLTRDRNGTCRLSETMVSDLCSVAGEQGLALKRGPIPFGGGGTDAAAFAAAGIRATSIIGVPTGLVGKDRVYHTSRDTVESIEVDAVRAVLELVTAYIRTVDSQAKE